MRKELIRGNTHLLDTQGFDLSTVTVGLGWDITYMRRRWWRRLLGGIEENFDLDAMAILLDANNKVQNFGIERDLGGGRKVGLIDSDVVFYNNLQHPSQTIWHTGDDLQGGTGGDNEQLILKLTTIPSIYSKILFLLCIHQGQTRTQHFGLLKNIYLRLVDARGHEIVRFDIPDSQAYAGKSTLVLAELIRQQDTWFLQASGDAYESDSFVVVLKNHV